MNKPIIFWISEGENLRSTLTNAAYAIARACQPTAFVGEGRDCREVAAEARAHLSQMWADLLSSDSYADDRFRQAKQDVFEAELDRIFAKVGLPAEAAIVS